MNPVFGNEIYFDGSAVSLTSFWSHYKIAQEWLRIENKARTNAICTIFGSNQQPQIEEQQGIHHEKKGNMENIAEQECDYLSAEMLEFYRTTIEHRKQRDKKRLQQSADEINSNKTIDEYFSASQSPQLDDVERNINIRNLYGENLAKLEEIESSIQNKYNEKFHKNNPRTWPNIPMRF